MESWGNWQAMLLRAQGRWVWCACRPSVMVLLPTLTMAMYSIRTLCAKTWSPVPWPHLEGRQEARRD